MSDASLKGSTPKLQVSAIDYLHYLNAESNYLDAEVAYEQAKYDYLQSPFKIILSQQVFR